MRKITDLQNVQSPDSTYPFGRVKDRTSGQNNGTPVNEAMVGDLLQFANKIMQVSEDTTGGDPPNGLPDNEYNGFQLYEALANIITFAINLNAENEKNATWNNLTLNSPCVSEPSGTYHTPQYDKDSWGWVNLRGALKTNTGQDLNGYLIATLPIGFRPVKKENHVVMAFDGAGYGGSMAVGISIETNGNITPYAFTDAGSTIDLNVLAIMDQSNCFLTLDGIRFKTT